MLFKQQNYPIFMINVDYFSNQHQQSIENSEYLIRSTLDAADPSAFCRAFVETILCLFDAAGAAELSADDADCSSPFS
jgi:hypothetical protein